MSESVFKELCSSQKLERDRGYHSLVTYLQSLDEEGIYNLQFDLLKLLNNVDSSWETKHGALMGTKAVLENGNVSDDFEIEVKKKVMEFLDDNEFRVRIAAGKLSIVQESFEAMPGGGNKSQDTSAPSESEDISLFSAKTFWEPKTNQAEQGRHLSSFMKYV